VGCGAGAGVDSAWEQEKLETRKILVNRTHGTQDPKLETKYRCSIENFFIIAGDFLSSR